MNLTPITDDGFEDDTAPSTPYVARHGLVARVRRRIHALSAWVTGLVRAFLVALGRR
jgi:hypothetical protein